MLIKNCVGIFSVVGMENIRYMHRFTCQTFSISFTWQNSWKFHQQIIPIIIPKHQIEKREMKIILFILPFSIFSLGASSQVHLLLLFSFLSKSYFVCVCVYLAPLFPTNSRFWHFPTLCNSISCTLQMYSIHVNLAGLPDSSKPSLQWFFLYWESIHNRDFWENFVTITVQTTFSHINNQFFKLNCRNKKSNTNYNTIARVSTLYTDIQILIWSFPLFSYEFKRS